MAPAASEAPIPSEAGGAAPVDRGTGPGRPPGPPSARPVRGGVPAGGPDAYLEGMFGPAVAWPINPIHAAVLPDGRLLTYGTDTAGKQGRRWSTTSGTRPRAR